ncbi:hypothetical protein K491DRAFT_43155 [Lophiostoma macrostomum CBS 122681]|uniref:Uncharacterized protein n=1 Tax=Lophiostoma macrostomum CBS 122681 TaxID=1314788 RepID=A0A6A6T1B4_9PLEO|nr:hypothetical protein K491DRAFT_43155 [Lophiostoma macrostomum CBS 122681]
MSATLVYLIKRICSTMTLRRISPSDSSYGNDYFLSRKQHPWIQVPRYRKGFGLVILTHSPVQPYQSVNSSTSPPPYSITESVLSPISLRCTSTGSLDRSTVIPNPYRNRKKVVSIFPIRQDNKLPWFVSHGCTYLTSTTALSTTIGSARTARIVP